MSHPALNRILRQISENKQQLTTPSESSEPTVPDSSEAVKEKAPLEEIASLFSDDNLEGREEELSKKDPVPSPPDSAQARGTPLPPDLEPERDLPPHLSEKEIAEEIAEEELYPDHTPLDQMPPDVQEYLKEEKETYQFGSIFDLKDFILQQQDSFDEYQKGALNSVVAAANAMNAGCKCKRGEMLKKVEDYYINFVKKNQSTSLIPKIKEILNTKKLIFSSNGEVFLTI